MSEEKLRAIEVWLVTDGPRASALWRIQGELELNLGRLELARRAASGQEPADPDGLASSVRTSRAGLEKVVGDIDATAAQRRRAQDGIARAEKLIAGIGPARAGGMPVIARAAWGAARARADRMDKNAAGWTRITVHHSADPTPVVLDGSSAKSFEAVREIQKAHMQGKSTHYGDIGYHFVIDPYGRVMQGRELAFQGAHANGENNLQNIGICLIGNFDDERPTSAALEALERQIEELRARHKIPKSRVLAHRELRPTECPGKHLMRWLESYRGGAALPAAKQSIQARTPDRATAARRTTKPARPLNTVH